MVLSEFGPPSVLVPREVAAPVAAAGEVVVEIVYFNVTFVETQFRAGRVGYLPGTLPMIPGNGVGGIVRSVGPNLDMALLGKRVVASTGGSGGYAEFVSVAATELIEVPDSLAPDHAVALLADGRTAMMLIQAVNLGAEDLVLVEAAAGGVGSLLLQLTRASGASVIAAVGGAQKMGVLNLLGRISSSIT